MGLSIPGSSYIRCRATETFVWPRASPVPAQLLPELPAPLPQEIPVPFGLCSSINTQCQGDTQSQHVQMSYPRYLASAVNGRNHGPATATGQDRHEYPPTVINNLGGTPGTVGWFMNPETLSVAADRVDHWAIDPSLGCNMAPRVEAMRVQGLPAYHSIGFNVPYTRRTKTGQRAPVSGPPQIFEVSPYVVAARLAYEGADPDTVDLIRCVIFVAEVTEKALTAPIISRELSLKYGGIGTYYSR